MGERNSMISFIIPFCSIDKKKNINIPETWDNNNWYSMVTMTIKVIKNIQTYRGEYEIILVDNSNNWPSIGIPNLKVVDGYQCRTKEELLKLKLKLLKFKLNNIYKIIFLPRYESM